MNTRIIERREQVAVNCLTGSFSVLAGILGRPVEERAVFEQGDGYLFQAGLDERGDPEYIFPVGEAGALGMRRTGFTVHADAIESGRIVEQLDGLLRHRRAVVVWVNTAHLGYAEAYRRNDPYLHAVVVDRIAADRVSVEVQDTLVVDRTPFSCRAVLSVSELVKASGDRIRSAAHDGMGYFYTAVDDGSPGQPAQPDALTRQAGRYFAEERFRYAVPQYRDLCLERLSGPREQAVHAARRLFHHASVLYAVPSLALMSRSLRAAGASAQSLDLHATAVRHWEAMGVLALRFEATAASSVLARIERRFAELQDVTTALWTSLRRD